MNKTWLTGITIAGIAGSGGMAFAGVNAIQNASAQSAPVAAETPAAAATRSVTYQIGVTGLVTIQSDGTTLTVVDPHPGTGWSFVGATSGAAPHVEVQFTDGQQLVTFIADQVGNDIVVAVTNVEAPGAATTTVAPEPIVVTVVSESPVRERHSAPPATPAPTPPMITPQHAVAPTAAATTKPSPKQHEEDDHEGDHEDSHESEHDDD